MLASPYSGDHLAQAIVTDFFGQLPAEAITREVASRVPELKRALVAHQSLVAPLRFEKFVAGSNAKAEIQPYWISSCDYPGMSRHIAYKQAIAELFWEGIAVLGCRLDTEGLVYDWIVVPRSMWSVDSETNAVEVHEEIPAAFRQRIVLVPLGTGGVMADGIDSIRQARKIEQARQLRLDSPPAATELHSTDQAYDNMTQSEQLTVIENYKAGRNRASVSFTPSYIEVKERGTTGQLDLFSDAKTDVSRDLAMHASVPSSFVESGATGGGGQMSYSNQNDRQSELWLFGSSQFAYALLAGLSADEVVGAGAEVRADTSAFAVPAPMSLDPEAGDTPGTEVIQP